MTTIYVAPTIAGTSYVIHQDGGGSWLVPSCPNGWTLRTPFPRDDRDAGAAGGERGTAGAGAGGGAGVTYRQCLSWARKLRPLGYEVTSRVLYTNDDGTPEYQLTAMNPLTAMGDGSIRTDVFRRLVAAGMPKVPDLTFAGISS